jgi:diguanylate cyclase (GGDEF)-like protein
MPGSRPEEYVAQNDLPSPGLRASPTVFRLAAFAAAAYTAAVLAASIVLPRPVAYVVIRTGTALAGLIAIGCAAWTAGHARGSERPWRILTVAAITGGEVFVVVTIMTSPAGRPNPDFSVYYAKSLLSALLLIVLLIFPTAPLTARDGCLVDAALCGRRWRMVLALESVLVTGALVLPGGAVLMRDTYADATTELKLAMVNCAAAVALAVAVVLVACFRRPRSPTAFALFASGLLVHTLTTGTQLYAARHGWQSVAPALSIGTVVGALLVALACLAPPPSRDRTRVLTSPRRLWAHALLPCVPLGVLAGWLSTQSSQGVVLALLLLVALARQVIVVAENARLLSRVRFQALHDPLTGLANRTLFTDRLNRAMARHTRHRHPIALLFCDLDDFKNVNDTLGHAAGDELLRTTARRLTSRVRSSDTVARVGGDEFAVILEADPSGSRGGDDPEAVARRIIEAVGGSSTLAGTPYTIRVSAGLATIEPDGGGVTGDVLLHHADLAMYAAKQQGKGDLVVYRGEPAASRPAAAPRPDGGRGTPTSRPPPAPPPSGDRRRPPARRHRPPQPSRRVRSDELPQVADERGPLPPDNGRSG